MKIWSQKLEVRWAILRMRIVGWMLAFPKSIEERFLCQRVCCTEVGQATEEMSFPQHEKFILSWKHKDVNSIESFLCLVVLVGRWRGGLGSWGRMDIIRKSFYLHRKENCWEFFRQENITKYIIVSFGMHNERVKPSLWRIEWSQSCVAAANRP